MNQQRLLRYLFGRTYWEFKETTRRRSFHAVSDAVVSTSLRVGAEAGNVNNVLKCTADGIGPSRQISNHANSSNPARRIQRHIPISALFPVPCRMCSEAREVDLSRTHFHFDTHALVKKLETSGFTVEQSEAITDALVQVLNSQIEQQNRNLVTKSQQEITIQQLLANISSVKKDMLILEKSEFSALRNDTEKQTMEINTMKKTVQDEVAKLKGQISLDLNLEKSRSKEAHAEGERNRSILNNRIDMEVANLKTTYEVYRNDVFKYAGGTVLSCLTITLGFYRLWS